jgi:DNA-binding MarR family transcriptional regulator
MSKSLATAPALPCMCASFRRAARALTQQYEAVLRPFGLKATQFTVLQVLSLAEEVSQGQLGRMLALDSTTLTRTLEILARHAWILERPGADRRERLLRLSPKGLKVLQRALPAWQKLQQRLRQRLGDEAWGSALALTTQITHAVTKGD